MIFIKEVKNKKELKDFILFPLKLYKNNKYYVPKIISDEFFTLSKDKNPAFEYCEAVLYLAYNEKNEIVGRIAGIINYKYIEKWKNKYARFGWIDFIEDFEVAKKLIEAVEQWAKIKGMEGIHGPLGFTDLDYEGMLVEGFEELGTLATIYNYPYYPEYIQRLGYVKDIDWCEFNIKTPDKIPEKVEKLAQLVRERRNYKILDAKTPKDYLPYAKQIFDIIDKAYADLYGVVPLTERQVETYIKQYFPNIDKDFVKVVLDENDNVVAFTIGMPSLSKALQKCKGKLFPFGWIHILLALKKPRYLDLYLGAVDPKHQGKGADVLMMVEMIKSAIKRKIISTETNPELEINNKVQSHWKYFDSRQHKRRRVFLKKF
ncbi:MAG: CUE domain-containing protein [Spirochaetes bacterium]|nr:CUE domain-containing protein [Spirochaetota bacterium]